MHLSKMKIGLVVSAIYTFETISFPIAGILMDTQGRKFSGVPSAALLGFSFLLVPMVHSVGALIVVAALSGLANGFSSGLPQTLSTDFAPEHGKSEFVGTFRQVTESGRLAGPLLVGVVGQCLSM